MEQRLALPHNHNSASRNIALSGEVSVTKKKKKVKLELAALVAKDLEELNRKRVVKQEPVEEADSLSRCSRAPVSSPPFYIEDSIESSPVHVVDKTAGVENTNTAGKTSTDPSSVMEIGTDHADNPLLEGGITAVRFLCVSSSLLLHSLLLGSLTGFHGNDRFNCMFSVSGLCGFGNIF